MYSFSFVQQTILFQIELGVLPAPFPWMLVSEITLDCAPPTQRLSQMVYIDSSWHIGCIQMWPRMWVSEVVMLEVMTYTKAINFLCLVYGYMLMKAWFEDVLGEMVARFQLASFYLVGVYVDVEAPLMKLWKVSSSFEWRSSLGGDVLTAQSAFDDLCMVFAFFWICRLTTAQVTGDDELRPKLLLMSVSLLCTYCTILMLSFWSRTIRYYDLKWNMYRSWLMLMTYVNSTLDSTPSMSLRLSSMDGL